MKQYRITTQDLNQSADDDCYLAPNDPIHELRALAGLGGLGGEARLHEYRAGLGSNISVTGDDNSVIVYQRSMRNVANIDVTNAGGPVSVNIQQLGSGYQDTGLNSASVTSYCGDSNGCTVNLTQY